MPTNLAIDDELIRHAKRIGDHKTKKQAVTAALEEYIQRREQLRIFDLMGKVDYEPGHDYKELRRRETPVAAGKPSRKHVP